MLDFLLPREKGVCGKLKLSGGDSCVHMAHVSVPLREQMNEVKRMAKDTREMPTALGTKCLGKVFSAFGISLLGRLSSLPQSLLTVIIVIVVVCIIISCIKSTLRKSVSAVKESLP